MSTKIERREDVNPKEGVREHGDVTFADPTNKKYPIDTPGRIKAAWAYIHQPSNARKYSAAERRTIIGRIRQEARSRRVALPDPEEFLELMSQVRSRSRSAK